MFPNQFQATLFAVVLSGLWLVSFSSATQNSNKIQYSNFPAKNSNHQQTNDNNNNLKPKNFINGRQTINWINYDENSGIDYYNAQQTMGTNNPAGSALAESPAIGSLASALGIHQNSNQMQTTRSRLAKQAPLNANLNAIESGQNDKVCMSETCVKSAAEILRNMDQRVEPCEDFYRYSCGGWIDGQVIPEDKTSVSLFTSVQDELDNKLRQLIEKRDPAPGEPPIVGKMRRLYESCMNTSKYHNE